VKFWRGQSTDAVNFEAHWKPQGNESFTGDKQAATRVEATRSIDVTLVSPAFPFLEIAFGSQPLISEHRIWPPPTTPPKTDLLVYNHAVPPDQALPRDVVLINPQQSGPWGERVGPMDRPLVSDVDKDAPLMRFADLTPVQLHTATEYSPPAGAHIYASSFGKPLIFGHWESEPRWLVIAFDLDASDFVFRTAFPILCANLIEPLRLDAVANTANVPGPVATRLKSIAAASGGEVSPKRANHFQWARAVPLWWWIACDGFLLLLVEWTLYTRRITE
jgi:hypothetical protein